MSVSLTQFVSSTTALDERVHATETAVAPAIAGQPTVAEIQAYATANAILNTLVYYTGNDVATDPVTYAYDLDNSGNATQIEAPGGASNNRAHADDTTVAPATAGQPTLSEVQAFVTAGVLVDTLVYYTGDDLPASSPTHVYAVDAAGVTTLLLEPGTSGSSNIIFYTNQQQMDQNLTDVFVSGDVAMVASPPRAWRTIIGGTGASNCVFNEAMDTSPYSGGGLASAFTGTGMTPDLHIYGHNYALALTVPNMVVNAMQDDGAVSATGFAGYTSVLRFTLINNSGIDTRTATFDTVYKDDTGADLGVVTMPPFSSELIEFIGVNDGTGTANWHRHYTSSAASSNNRLHADDTTVAPATAGEPTVAEITTFAGANTDTIIYYTGTDTATDPITYVYHIDNSGNVTQIEAPSSEAILFGNTATASVTKAVTDTENGEFIHASTFDTDFQFDSTTFSIGSRVYIRTNNTGSIVSTTGFILRQLLPRNGDAPTNVASPLAMEPGVTYEIRRHNATFLNIIEREASATGDFVKEVHSAVDPLITDSEEPGTIWVNDTSGAGFISTIDIPATGDSLDTTAGTPGSSINIESQERWQSFTTTAGGDITAIAANVIISASGTTITARIRDGIGDTGTLIGTATFTSTGPVTNATPVVFTPVGTITLAAATQYSLTLQRTSGGAAAGWQAANADILPGETSEILGAVDYMFSLGTAPPGAGTTWLPLSSLQAASAGAGEDLSYFYSTTVTGSLNTTTPSLVVAGTNVGTGITNNGDGSFTINTAGIYEFDANVVSNGGTAQGAYPFWADGVGGPQIGSRASSAHTAASPDAVVGGGNAHAIVDGTVGQVIWLDTLQTATFGGLYITIKQLPSSTVVDPSSVPVIDDDTMATALATNIASAESVKAYVDANAGGAPLSSADQTLTASRFVNGGGTNKITFQNVNGFEVGSAGPIQLDSVLGQYDFGDGAGANLPAVNSTHGNLWPFIDPTTGRLGLSANNVSRSLSGIADPTNGTTVAYYIGQLYINRTTGNVFHATTASTAADISGAGSVWAAIAGGAGGGSILDANGSQTGPRNHDFGAQGQTWNNMGNWNVFNDTSKTYTLTSQNAAGTLDGTFSLTNAVAEASVTGLATGSLSKVSINSNGSEISFVEGNTGSESKFLCQEGTVTNDTQCHIHTEGIENSTVTTGQVLTLLDDNTGECEWAAAGGAFVIDDATDVDTTTTAPANGDVLEWDGTNWVPQAPGAGGTTSNGLMRFQGDVDDISSDIGFHTSIGGALTMSTAFATSTRVNMGTGNSEFTDVNGISIGANNFVIAFAGRYDIRVELLFDTGDTGWQGIQLVHNGDPVGRGHGYADGNGNSQGESLIWQGDVDVNDTFDVRIDDENGGNTISISMCAITVTPI